jgi:hypothetical protein
MSGSSSLPPEPAASPGAGPEDNPAEAEPELERRLREAGSEELLALLRDHAGTLTAPAALQALRNPFCAVEAIEIVAAQARLLSFYELRRELAIHPRSPETLAMRFVPGLWWRDLVALGLDARLRPTLRRAADVRLAARLPELAVGERVSLARRAGPGVISHLRSDSSPQVIAALLDNPRLTEGVLAPLLHGGSTSPAILELIAADRRWGVRYPLRVALARNPRTPVETVLRILTVLRKPDQKAVASDPRLLEAVRRRARLLLGEE